jgi:hypothetical protein
MDARGVQRLLEKIHGLAETATTVGAKSAEAMRHEPRLSDRLKQQLWLLYRKEALQRTMLSAAFGLAICRALEPELDDAAARDRLEFFRVRFQALYEHAQSDLEKEFAESSALEPPQVE